MKQGMPVHCLNGLDTLPLLVPRPFPSVTWSFSHREVASISVLLQPKLAL